MQVTRTSFFDRANAALRIVGMLALALIVSASVGLLTAASGIAFGAVLLGGQALLIGYVANTVIGWHFASYLPAVPSVTLIAVAFALITLLRKTTITAHLTAAQLKQQQKLSLISMFLKPIVVLFVAWLLK